MYLGSHCIDFDVFSATLYVITIEKKILDTSTRLRKFGKNSLKEISLGDSDTAKTIPIHPFWFTDEAVQTRVLGTTPPRKSAIQILQSINYSVCSGR